MPFDAREETEKTAEDYPPFEFTGLDGKQYELPNPVTLTERQADRINKGDPKGLLEAVAPEAYEAIQEMQLHVSSRLVEAWLGEAGDSGKSRSPSRATRRAEQRSKRTSPSAAST